MSKKNRIIGPGSRVDLSDFVGTLPLLDTWSWLALVVDNSMEHDLVRVLWVVGGVTLAPVVTDSVGEDVAVEGEGGGDDGAADGWVALETMLGVLVPEVEGSVGAGGAEGAVDWVERDGVDGVDVVDVGCRRITVALEGEVQAIEVSMYVSHRSLQNLPRILIIHVLHGATTLDGANSKALSILETSNSSGLVLQRRLESLVDLAWVGQVDNVDIAFSGSNNEEVILNIHGINSILHGDRCDSGRLAQIPVLDSLIPGTSNDHRVSTSLEEAHTANRLVVGSNLGSGSSSSAEVDHASCLVCSCANNLCAVLLPC